MSKGNILIALGAVVVIICFFLPWVSIPAANLKFTGQELAAGPKVLGVQVQAAKPALWVTFACAIGCLVVVAGAFIGVLKSKLGSVVAILLAVVGLVLMLVSLTGGPAGTKMLFWLIVTIVAEVVILAGAGWNLLEKSA
jgi:hypothetical protein